MKTWTRHKFGSVAKIPSRDGIEERYEKIRQLKELRCVPRMWGIKRYRVTLEANDD